jgi:hypothetical protein
MVAVLPYLVHRNPGRMAEPGRFRPGPAHIRPAYLRRADACGAAGKAEVGGLQADSPGNRGRSATWSVGFIWPPETALLANVPDLAEPLRALFEAAARGRARLPAMTCWEVRRLRPDAAA